MKTTQHSLVFLKRHSLKVAVVVNLDLLYFFYNLKRTNEKKSILSYCNLHASAGYFDL